MSIYIFSTLPILKPEAISILANQLQYTLWVTINSNITKLL